MKIGSVELPNNVFLAPMAGISDIPFRLLCREQGCGLVYTEMISAKGLYYKDQKTNALLKMHEKEKPVAVQIFGSEPEIMAQAAQDVAKAGASIIDINMGCPTPKIVKNGEGSALMLKPDAVAKIVKTISGSVNIPVTVKIRKGWDDKNINAEEIAVIAEENGAKAIAVHGRTQEQFYSGNADWDIIREVKERVKIPVIGNGDIFSPEDAKQMLEHTDCDGVMIGRGARGNPWIFARVLHYLNTGEIFPEPTTGQRIEKAIEHVRLLALYKGEYIGIKEARKHIAWYVKGMKNAAKIKQAANKICTLSEMEAFLLNILTH